MLPRVRKDGGRFTGRRLGRSLHEWARTTLGSSFRINNSNSSNTGSLSNSNSSSGGKNGSGSKQRDSILEKPLLLSNKALVKVYDQSHILNCDVSWGTDDE